MTRNGLDGYLCVPMTAENIVIPEDLVNALFAVLHGFKGVGKTNPKPIKELIAACEKYDQLLSTPVDAKMVLDRSLTCLEEVSKGQ